MIYFLQIYFPIFLNSNTTITIAQIPAIKSAIGPATKIPSIPQKVGRIRINGSRNIICLVMDKNTPLMDLPMEVKKVDVIGCKALNQVKNNMMRKAFVPNSKYSGLPFPNRLNNCLGMVWNRRKEQKEIAQPVIVANL